MSDNENEVYEDDDIEVITLEFDDGEAEDFEVIGVFEHEGADYIALGPLAEDEMDHIYLYRYIEDGEDSFVVESIDSDELFEAVAATFESLIEEAE